MHLLKNPKPVNCIDGSDVVLVRSEAVFFRHWIPHVYIYTYTHNKNVRKQPPARPFHSVINIKYNNWSPPKSLCSANIYPLRYELVCFNAYKFLYQVALAYPLQDRASSHVTGSV